MIFQNNSWVSYSQNGVLKTISVSLQDQNFIQNCIIGYFHLYFLISVWLISHMTHYTASDLGIHQSSIMLHNEEVCKTEKTCHSPKVFVLKNIFFIEMTMFVYNGFTIFKSRLSTFVFLQKLLKQYRV